MSLAAPVARIVLFGNASGTSPSPLPPVARLLAGNVAIAGFSLAGLTATDPARVADRLTDILDRLVADDLAFDVRAIQGLDAAAGAQQAIADGRVTVKQVIAIRPGPARPRGRSTLAPNRARQPSSVQATK